MTLLHYFFDFTSFYRLGQKYKNIFVRFLVQMKTFKSPFEINLPLVMVEESNRCLVSIKYFYGPMEFSLNSFSPFPSEALLYIVSTNTNLDSFL